MNRLIIKFGRTDLEVGRDIIPSILPKDRVETCNHVYDIVGFLEENPELNTAENSIVEVALEKREELNSDKKVEFIKELLALLLSNPNVRRYSNDLLATEVLWQNASPAC